MTDYFADRIPLNPSTDMTSDGTHGVTGAGIIASDPNPGENSGMNCEILKAPDDTKKMYVKEFPSQSADIDQAQKAVVVNPQATN